jgi:hypothetical protein
MAAVRTILLLIGALGYTVLAVDDVPQVATHEIAPVANRDFASGYARHLASGASKFRQWLSTTTAEEINDNNQNQLTKASNSGMNQVSWMAEVGSQSLTDPLSTKSLLTTANRPFLPGCSDTQR